MNQLALASLLLLACAAEEQIDDAAGTAEHEEDLKNATGHENEGRNCSCKGAIDHKHGRCGYHAQWGDLEDRPWCRTQNECGIQSWHGTWMFCDPRSVERRRDGQNH